MTTTLPAAARAAGTASLPAAHRAARAAGRSRRGLLHTPAKLRALLTGLVLLSLAWGALGGWVATQHSSAADSLVSVNERLSLNSREMYQSIADADATITAAFLASPTPPLNQLQRYEDDLTTAHGDLSRLQAAGGRQAVDTALAQLSVGLFAYSAYVGEATAEYAMGYPLTGGSYLQVASGKAHVLLPAASTVFTQENAALNGANGQATELPTEIALLVLAVITGFVLYRAQRWLGRRTNRVLSPGLVLASVLLAVSVIWLAAGFLSARSNLDSGIGHGSAPVATAGRDATSWYAANNQVYRLGTASNYAGERTLVVGTTGGAATGYNALEGDLTQAINADQAVFASAAADGANVLDPLTGVVIATSLLMAAGCAWAIRRRLAEYR